MKILNRYIATHIISATMLVSLVFLGVQSFIDFVEQLADVGQKSYGVTKLLQFVLLSLPSDFYQLFPIIALLGSLLGLGYLASSNQLIIMQSSGTSIFKITWAAVRATLFMLIFVTIIGEWIAPQLQNYATRYKAISMGQATGLSAFRGGWLHQQNDFIYVGGFQTPTQLKNLTLYSFDNNHRLRLLYYAEQGNLTPRGWVLTNVQKTSFSKQRISTQTLQSFPIDLDIQPKMLAQTILENSNTLTLNEMYHYIRYLNRYNLNTFFVQFNFWQRIIQPLTTLVMVVLSIPFIFGSLRHVSTGSRVVVGITAGLIFYILNQFFGPFSLLFQLPAWLAAISPTLFFLLACVVWLLFGKMR